MEVPAALVAAAERNDADAVERIQRAARGDDDALCDAFKEAHRRAVLAFAKTASDRLGGDALRIHHPEATSLLDAIKREVAA